MTAALSLRAVTKTFPGQVAALRDVSLDVASGELVSVVGPSGSGKSTLLRIVAGLEDPTAGAVLIDEKAAPPSPRERDVALVFQSHSLFPHLDAFDNMAYGLRARGRGGEAKARVEAAARTLGIEDLLARRPDALSGGERQRVALGRALARRARVLLLDEPLSSLDAHLRAGLRREILAVHREIGGVTLLVTHDQGEALGLGDRVVVLDRGVVQQVAIPQVLLDRPANRFVAGFIGVPATAFFEGRLDEDGAMFRCADGALPIADRWRAPLRSRQGQSLVLGVRPAHWLERGGGAEPFIPARVLLVERTPAGDAHVQVRFGDQEVTVAFAGAPPAAGGSVSLRPDPERALFFDPASGVSLDPSGSC
jgi:multiple sugar transport system ATP-binding protein